MPPAQNPSFVTIGWQKTVLLRNIQYYCSNVQPSRMGGWAYKGRAVVVNIVVHTGNKAPQVVDAVDAVVGGLEKDR